jgi:parallel beta-helix repeat protein
MAAPVRAQSTLYVDDDNCPGPGSGSPDDPFCRIQDAIAGASGGDLISVAPGLYVENVSYLGKAVSVESTDGPAATTIQAEQSDRVVQFISGEGPASVLDGFTITGGAGGIACAGSSPRIENCIITGNNADTGAGIHCHNGSPVIEDCLIHSNVAGIIGGGINCNAGSDPMITGCTISDNTASNGGGMYIVNGSSPTISQCTISENTVTDSGGGIVSAGPGTLPTIVDCVVSGNSAAAAAGISCGGGSDPLIVNSIIEANVASQVGGGVLCNDSAPTIANCLISGNTASFNGAGVYNWSNGGPLLVGCTIAGNSTNNGGGVYSGSGSYPVLANCIVWDNSGGAIRQDASSATIVTFSDIEDGWAGTGNIAANPMFFSPSDYHVRPGSPCIDAADNTAVPDDLPDLDGDGNTAEPLPLELDGSDRFVDDPDTVDTGNGSLPIVDMGAYEYRQCDDNADCDDGVYCTIDTCDEETHTCVYTPDDSFCDNGLYCDGIETCDPVEGCQGAVDPCLSQDLLCDEANDRCVECLLDAHCYDGDPCSEDTCNVDGSCVYVTVCGACCLPDNTCEQMMEDTCIALAGEEGFNGVGSPCLGDNDGNGYDDACEPPAEVPAVSTWGLVILALLFLTAGKLYARRPGRVLD